MAKKQPKKVEYPSIELTARVSRRSSGKPYKASQEEMCEMFEVSDRTLREWHSIGLPKETDAKGRPVYPFPDANIWAMCYRAMVRASGNRKGPRHLTVDQANDWHLERQVREFGMSIAIVPMEWDHPMRETMLRRAAAGCGPPPPI